MEDSVTGKVLGFLLSLLLLQHRHCSALEVTVPPDQSSPMGRDALLPCTFRVDNPPMNPKFLAILWHFGDKEVLRYDNKGKVSSPRVSIDERALLEGNASLSLSNVTVSDGGTYRCSVIYSPETQKKEIRLRIHALPEVVVAKRTLVRNQGTALRCSVTDFYPQRITVTWLRNGKVLPNSALGPLQQNADGTFRLNSTLTLTPSDTEDTPEIACLVQHESLPTPRRDSFRVQYGVPPSVQVYSAKINGRPEQVLVCEASQFQPEPVRIQWLLNGKIPEDLKKSRDGGFKTGSYYVINPTGGIQVGNISCAVEHETLLLPITETLQLSPEDTEAKYSAGNIAAAIFLTMLLMGAGITAGLWFLIYKRKYFQRFRVSHIHRSQTVEGKKVTLYCVASDCPKGPRVIWSVQGHDGKKTEVAEDEAQAEGEGKMLLGQEFTVRTDRTGTDGRHNVTSSLSFTPDVSAHKDMVVFCKFVCDGKAKEEQLHCSFISAKPKDYIKLSLSDSGEVLSRLTLQEFYPRGIQIRWSCGVGHYQELESINERFTPNSNYTYNTESECKILGQLFTDPGFKVRVTWNQQSSTGQGSREFSARDPEFPWCPWMEEIIKPALKHNSEGRFQCEIRGYFPKALEVKWLRREAGGQELFSVSPSEKYKIPEMEQKKEADGTFSCTAALIVSVSGKSDNGAEFICRVGHPSLGEPLDRSTGALSVTGVPVVRSCTQRGKYIIMEIDQFYPQDIGVTWQRAEKEPKDYKPIPDVQNKLYQNSDGTYRLTSICEGMGLMDRMNPNDFYFTARVQHEALNPPIQKEFLRKEGNPQTAVLSPIHMWGYLGFLPFTQISVHSTYLYFLHFYLYLD
ncbi:uncharacterized protein LOC100496188 [Xenopus tropicalis]|uniref:Uncharacterized protein LOC100496188 n=1 Tax=Xenopus tropicalis TaxID=8364 RepID=A0A8J1ISY4_XENTR|nr:uncharacterized protein LOC100496188 [Xenopus tropicalis]XP_031748714.1 uncharacterized protein LOC100496188 [Xenopus tropicalis]